MFYLIYETLQFGDENQETMNSVPIAKPEKFQNQIDFQVWLGQFELLCKLAKLDDDRKAIYLLANSDLPIYEATISGVTKEDQKDFNKLTKFLETRYCKKDSYCEEIDFFKLQYSGTAEEYAAKLQKSLDNFKNVSNKEELLVAKCIATVPDTYAVELRLR